MKCILYISKGKKYLFFHMKLAAQMEEEIRATVITEPLLFIVRGLSCILLVVL